MDSQNVAPGGAGGAALGGLEEGLESSSLKEKRGGWVSSFRLGNPPEAPPTLAGWDRGCCCGRDVG